MARRKGRRGGLFGPGGATERMEKKGTEGSFGPATGKNIKRGLRAGGKQAKKAAFAKAMATIAARRRGRSARRG